MAVIISHKHKFIFIKTAKTAGTSIEVFLSRHCGREDVLTPIFPHVEPHVARNYEEKEFFNHIPAADIKKKVSREIWNNYFKFCVERNPWDKTLSHYHMLRFRAENNLSLDEYFEKGQFCFNYPKYTDNSGSVIVDRIVKYENLSEELAYIFRRLNIPFEGSLGVKAKSEYRTDRRHYKEILSTEQAEIISKAFSREIELFGYSFQ
ncbi:sulfotransferase family 2 domain-containing protein [uncultured Desulfuromonas sp.]|uniref:sulfotransferase family 2 domain-containing protein n=1 Tax=uncultured Desulfuromonas sp. TaxID=181013 RepID=UPI0026390D31|nr:sulfotransferase family 2 domain-containing protein [uncultured Desulfuromonas sp.]